MSKLYISTIMAMMLSACGGDDTPQKKLIDEKSSVAKTLPSTSNNQINEASTQQINPAPISLDQAPLPLAQETPEVLATPELKGTPTQGEQAPLAIAQAEPSVLKAPGLKATPSKLDQAPLPLAQATPEVLATPELKPTPTQLEQAPLMIAQSEPSVLNAPELKGTPSKLDQAPLPLAQSTPEALAAPELKGTPTQSEQAPLAIAQAEPSVLKAPGLKATPSKLDQAPLPLAQATPEVLATPELKPTPTQIEQAPLPLAQATPEVLATPELKPTPTQLEQAPLMIAQSEPSVLNAPELKGTPSKLDQAPLPLAQSTPEALAAPELKPTPTQLEQAPLTIAQAVPSVLNTPELKGTPNKLTQAPLPLAQATPEELSAPELKGIPTQVEQAPLTIAQATPNTLNAPELKATPSKLTQAPLPLAQETPEVLATPELKPTPTQLEQAPLAIAQSEPSVLNTPELKGTPDKLTQMPLPLAQATPEVLAAPELKDTPTQLEQAPLPLAQAIPEPKVEVLIAENNERTQMQVDAKNHAQQQELERYNQKRTETQTEALESVLANLQQYNRGPATPTYDGEAAQQDLLDELSQQQIIEDLKSTAGELPTYQSEFQMDSTTVNDALNFVLTDVSKWLADNIDSNGVNLSQHFDFSENLNSGGSFVVKDGVYNIDENTISFYSEYTPADNPNILIYSTWTLQYNDLYDIQSALDSLISGSVQIRIQSLGEFQDIGAWFENWGADVTDTSFVIIQPNHEYQEFVFHTQDFELVDTKQLTEQHQEVLISSFLNAFTNHLLADAFYIDTGSFGHISHAALNQLQNTLSAAHGEYRQITLPFYDETRSAIITLINIDHIKITIATQNEDAIEATWDIYFRDMNTLMDGEIEYIARLRSDGESDGQVPYSSSDLANFLNPNQNLQKDDLNWVYFHFNQ